jgi:hypothetical protein
MADSMSFAAAILASRATKAAVWVFALGWLPLLLYLPFAEPDANPIGLGLLAWFATLVALPLVLAGIARGYLRWRNR